MWVYRQCQSHSRLYTQSINQSADMYEQKPAKPKQLSRGSPGSRRNPLFPSVLPFLILHSSNLKPPTSMFCIVDCSVYFQKGKPAKSCGHRWRRSPWFSSLSSILYENGHAWNLQLVCSVQRQNQFEQLNQKAAKKKTKTKKKEKEVKKQIKKRKRNQTKRKEMDKCLGVIWARPITSQRKKTENGFGKKSEGC